MVATRRGSCEMRFDRLIRSHFWILVFPLLAVCAFFQACGVTALVASSVLSEARPVLPEPPAGGRASAEVPAPSSSAREKDAETILARNVFDSVIGPLGPEVDPPAPPPKPTNPLRAPKCEDVAVTSTVEDEDPLWSSAVVRGPKAARGKLRRVGDPVGDRRVAYIGFNPLERSPAVWLTGDEGLCQTILFVDRPAKPAARKAKARKAKSRRKAKAQRGTRPKPRRRPPPVPKAIARRIERISPTEFHVDRRAVDAIFEQHARLMRSVRVKPNQQNGKTTSLTLGRVTRNSLLGALGLKNGDQLLSVNGFSLTSPARALQAYARLRTAGDISLKLKRKGRPMIIDYRIR
jgi:general secretion pathway protein C